MKIVDEGNEVRESINRKLLATWHVRMDAPEASWSSMLIIGSKEGELPLQMRILRKEGFAGCFVTNSSFRRVRYAV